MKLLAVAAFATLAAAELTACVQKCAEETNAANATACASKEFESADCLCEYGFTSTVRKCMYTACATEVSDWVAVYRGASCPEGTYSSNTTSPHAAGGNSTSNSTGASAGGASSGAAAAGSATGSAAAAGSSAPAASATGTSAATAFGVPVLGAAFAAAIVAAL